MSSIRAVWLAVSLVWTECRVPRIICRVGRYTLYHTIPLTCCSVQPFVKHSPWYLVANCCCLCCGNSFCNFSLYIHCVTLIPIFFCVFYANDGAVHLMLLMMTFTSFLVRCLPFFCATCVLFLYKYVFYCCFLSRLQLTQLNHNGSFNLFNRIVKIKICFVFVNICIII